MSIRAFTRIAAAALVLGASLTATSARAEVTDGAGNIEIYAGWYFPDDSGMGESYDDLTLGLRAGYTFTKHLGIEATIGWYEGDADYTNWIGFGKTSAQPSIIPLDISIMGYINSDSRAVFNIYGGIGYAFQDFDVDVNCNALAPPADAACRAAVAAVEDTDDSFTVHAGLGAKIDVTDSFYMRPDARVRWFENRDDNEMDWEISLGFGWWFGK